MTKLILNIFLLSLFWGKTFAQITPARQQNSLRFNNQLLLAPAVTQLKLGTTFTMAAWVNPSSRVAYSIVMGKPAPNRGQDPFMGYVISWNQDGTKLEFVQSTGMAGTYRAVTSPTASPLNAWTHVAATLQNGTMRLFINGTEVGSTASPGAPAVNEVPFALGGGLDGANYCCGMNGALMQASVWSKALSATEITNLASTTPAANANGLIAYWKLDEGAGQVVNDLSNNQIDLQLGMSPSADNRDPNWISNFIFNEGPFFRLHQSSLDIPHHMAEVFPFVKNPSSAPDFVGISLQWPPLAPPGAFRPLEYFTVENNQVKVKTSQAIVGAPQMVHARHAAQGDFNRDGRNDLLMIGHGTDTHPYPGEQSLILIQQPDGTLKDESSTRLPAAIDFTHHVTVADIDKDGDLDIYFANIGGGTNGPRILLNNGTGFFTVAPNALPSQVANRNKVYTSSVFADFDNDGDDDLFLGADERSEENLILFNNGQGVFEVTAKSKIDKHPDNTWIGVGVAVADFDKDGDLDLISNNTRGFPFYQGAFLQYLLNDGTGVFTDQSSRLPNSFSQSTPDQEWVVWVDTLDINKDGWTDLITKGNGKAGLSKLFINHGGFFEDKTDLLPLGFAAGSGLRAGDFNLDKDVDLVAFEGKMGYVLENVKNYNNSIAHISTSGKNSYCAGATVNSLLTASSGVLYTHQWLKNNQPIANATGVSFTATEPGNYQVISKNGEYPAATSLAFEITKSAGAAATIVRNGNRLTASEGGAYKWYLDGQLIPSFTSREITPIVSGSYYVEVVTATGCAVSAAFQYSGPTGVKEFTDGHLQLYPNPTANGTVILSLNNFTSFKGALVQVVNLNGQVCSQFTINQKQLTLQLPMITGLYIIKVINDKAIYVTKVIKK
jgi:hypothetical protein